MRGQLFTGVHVLFLSACGPGVADFNERIGESDLFYMNTGQIQRFIARVHEDGAQEIVIDTRVVSYVENEDVIFVARQPTADWECADGVLKTTVERNLEYWVVDLETGKASGPVGYQQLEDFAVAANDIPEYARLSPEVLGDDLIEVTLKNCSAPKKH